MKLPSPRKLEFCGRFTLLTMTWNQCEVTARQILQAMLGDVEPAIAVVAEIQNRSLCHALRASARDKRFAELREAIEHFADGYDRLLSYRNYYTHALFGVDDGGGGGLLSISAKGRIQWTEETVSRAKLADIAAHMHRLLLFGIAIRKELGGAMGSKLAETLEQHHASLDKPQWPETLKKLPHYLQE